MRAFAVIVSLFVTSALPSSGVGGDARDISARPKTVLWSRTTIERYDRRDILRARDARGNRVTVSLAEPPSHGLLPFLEYFSAEDYASNIQFHLFTRTNRNLSQILYMDNTTSVEKSNFNKSRETVVLIHGYLNDVNAPMVQLIKNSMLERGDFNVIAVDWSRVMGKEWFYWQVANDAEIVGRYVGDFLAFLVENQYQVASRLYLVGHSLGAHSAGFAGRQLQFLKNETVPRITGLDPALPCFEKRSETRLSPTDAQFVDCIHTCGGYLGYDAPLCHSDFYPNGGVLQPGCSKMDDIIGICSHSRAYQYYAASVEKGHLFKTYKCESVPTPRTPVLCNESDALMGFPAEPQYTGIFYLTTNSDYSYSNTLLSDYEVSTPL